MKNEPVWPPRAGGGGWNRKIYTPWKFPKGGRVNPLSVTLEFVGPFLCPLWSPYLIILHYICTCLDSRYPSPWLWAGIFFSFSLKVMFSGFWKLYFSQGWGAGKFFSFSGSCLFLSGSGSGSWLFFQAAPAPDFFPSGQKKRLRLLTIG